MFVGVKVGLRFVERDDAEEFVAVEERNA